MIFTIDREIFLENLLVASRAISSKTVVPILTGVKIEATKTHLSITACNTDLAINVTFNDKSLEVEQEGVIVYDGKQLLDIIRTQNAKTIKMMLVDDKLVELHAGRFRSDLILFEHDNYPEIEFLSSSEALVVKAKIIKQLIKETAYAAGTNEKRPILTGVNLSYKETLLEAIATDSFRLSKKVINLENDFKEFNIVIPQKTLDELQKSIEGYNDDLKIYFSKNQILFKFKNVLFQSRILEGAYPDTSRLIPENFKNCLKFNREDLIGAIERVGVLSPKDKENNYNIVRLINSNDNYCEIKTRNNEKGAASELVVVHDEKSSEEFKIAFSSKYILDALRALQSEFITFSFNDETKPFTIEGESDLNLIHLILPIKVEW